MDEARGAGVTFVTDDTPSAISSDAVEIVIDAAGSPAAGTRRVTGG